MSGSFHKGVSLEVIGPIKAHYGALTCPLVAGRAGCPGCPGRQKESIRRGRLSGPAEGASGGAGRPGLTSPGFMTYTCVASSYNHRV